MAGVFFGGGFLQKIQYSFWKSSVTFYRTVIFRKPLIGGQKFVFQIACPSILFGDPFF